MKKNGFTLAELIAIIIIFSLILTIIVPTGSYVFTNSKAKAFKNRTEELVAAVDLAIVADNLSVDTLNGLNIVQMFKRLGINESHAENFKNITFNCYNMNGTLCTDYTVYAVGNGKYNNYTAFGHNNNLSAVQLTTEIGITMNYINVLNNHMKTSPISDGKYNISSITGVSPPLQISNGTVEVSNNRVVDYSIDFNGKTVVYNQEKRLPIIK